MVNEIKKEIDKQKKLIIKKNKFRKKDQVALVKHPYENPAPETVLLLNQKNQLIS